MRTKLHLVTAAAAFAVALLAASAAAGTRPPTAGAPHYLHWGAGGLCIPVTNWDAVEEIEFDPATRVLAIEGVAGAYDFVTIAVDGQGTATVWDDMLDVRLESYTEGPPDVEVLDPPLPLYDPGAGGGGRGWTTENTPKELYVKRIEFSASTSQTNGVTNNSPIPMYARGFFGLDGDVVGFFNGGSGPDCVTAVTGTEDEDNDIDTRGGADYVRAGFGDDSLSGGDGPDTIIGGSGDDELRGGGDVDHLQGQAGSDCYSGSQADGLTDLLDDPVNDFGEGNDYAAEEDAEGDFFNIEYITEAKPSFVTDCI